MATAFGILAFILILHLSSQVNDLKKRMQALEASNSQGNPDA
jgi:hypothetical protein